LELQVLVLSRFIFDFLVETGTTPVMHLEHISMQPTGLWRFGRLFVRNHEYDCICPMRISQQRDFISRTGFDALS
jgi:hypothetical protein